jgi:UDP-glucose 4-epimerase
MKRILVTGSSGKLGRKIVKELLKRDYNVLGIDITKSETTSLLADIRNNKEILAITKDIDGLIHTAALHGKHYELNYPREDFIKTNIEGTFNLLTACVKNGIKKFLYTSTTSIYGKAMKNPEQAVWVDETLTPDPRDIYDITKLTAELLCRDFFEKEGIETTVLRVSRFLQEEENIKAIHRLYRGLDEQDGATGHILALEKKFPNFEIYNISNDTPFTKQDLKGLFSNPKEIIKKYYPDVESFFEKKGWVFPNSIDRVYSIDKAKMQLGYKPIKNFDTFIV